MNIDRQYLIGGGVAVVLLLAAIAYWIWGGGASTPIQTAGECKAKETFTITNADYTLGKADAPVTIVEYASMTCPHCARFSRDVFPLLKSNYIDKGYVHYVFREFPLDSVALAVSVVGRCLPRDAYLPYVEMMYAEQDNWGRKETEEELKAAIKEMARRAGMSGEEFDKCTATRDDANKIVAAQEAAVKDYCIGGVPAFFMNGKVLASGEIPWAELDEKLRAELKTKGVTVPGTPAASSETPAAGTVPEGSPTPPAPASSAAPAPAAPGTETPATPAPATPATGTPPNP